MTSRRFLFYFLVATTFTIAATVAFQVYFLKQAAQQTSEEKMLYARSVARFVGGMIDAESARLDAMLAALPADLDRDKARHALAGLTGAMLDPGGVALFGDKLNQLAVESDPGGMAPPEMILPALRRARETKARVVTDLWKGLDGLPRVALVQGHESDGKWRAAVAPIRLDSDAFLRAFGYFLVDERSRLQLLDSDGIALFSTVADERYKSAVHGTYFNDKVREGEAVQMRCHSCHTDESGGEVRREAELTTVAPVPGTRWSVTVREPTEEGFLTQTVVASTALVCIIFGAFLGFYIILRRRVLRPLRALAKAAVAVSKGDLDVQLNVSGRGDVYLIERSFESMREQVRKGTAAPAAAEPPKIKKSA